MSGNSKNCLESGSCAAFEACKAAESMVQLFAEDNSKLLPNRWGLQRLSILKMRKLAIEQTAALVDCGYIAPEVDVENPEQSPTELVSPTIRPCPLPFGIAENTAFGPPEEMMSTAIHIAGKQSGTLGFDQP